MRARRVGGFRLLSHPMASLSSETLRCECVRERTGIKKPLVPGGSRGERAEAGLGQRSARCPSTRMCVVITPHTLSHGSRRVNLKSHPSHLMRRATPIKRDRRRFSADWAEYRRRSWSRSRGLGSGPGGGLGKPDGGGRRGTKAAGLGSGGGGFA